MSKPHDTAPLDWVTLTARLRPDLHAQLEERKRAGSIRSINMTINEAVESYLAQAGGAAEIAKMRRRLLPRSNPAHAAAAYLLGYLGNEGQARRWWPWSGRFTVKAGDPVNLPLAGALIAAEIDKTEGKWGTSGKPSAVN